MSFLIVLMTKILVSQEVPAIEMPAMDAPAPLSPSEILQSSPGPKKKIIYREKSYFEFEDTLINGNLRAPDGSFIFRKSQSTFSSALNLRRSFIPELKASSNDAR